MIDLENVEVDVARKRIVENIDLNVGRGEFVGIIGPNGSGKSTLLKAVYRYLKPSAGAIMIDGSDIAEQTLKESALKTAAVTQHNTYNFSFKAREVVMMGRSPHKTRFETESRKDAEIVDKAIADVGMTEFAQRNFITLSGGEQQRIVLARALAQETPCIVLDEPTNHLDVKYQLQLMDVVKSMGLTTLAALHDLNIAASYCDRLYLLSSGRIVAEGTPEEVLTAENIREYYGVEAHVRRSEFTGLLTIEYCPGFIANRSRSRSFNSLDTNSGSGLDSL